MVALSGGLFLSIMVFALSRDTSRFYQRENRLAGAVMAGMSGFERLKADIGRAGYLASPNIMRDPLVATRPQLGWPVQLANMAGLRINPDTPATNASNVALVAAGLTPDEIVLAGSYSVTDRFAVSSTQSANSFTLSTNMGAMARLGYLKPGLTAADQTAILAQVFRPGRVIRRVDDTGLASFGVISTVSGGPTPTITLTNASIARSGFTTIALGGFESASLSGGAGLNIIDASGFAGSSPPNCVRRRASPRDNHADSVPSAQPSRCAASARE